MQVKKININCPHCNKTIILNIVPYKEYSVDTLLDIKKLLPTTNVMNYRYVCKDCNKYYEIYPFTACMYPELENAKEI